MHYLLVLALATTTLCGTACTSSSRTRSSLVAPLATNIQASSLTGTWVGIYHSGPVGTAKVTLTFKVYGSDYTGTFSTSTGAKGTTSGSISGNTFSVT